MQIVLGIYSLSICYVSSIMFWYGFWSRAFFHRPSATLGSKTPSLHHFMIQICVIYRVGEIMCTETEMFEILFYVVILNVSDWNSYVDHFLNSKFDECITV